MSPTTELQAEVLRIADENLRWEPSIEQINNIIHNALTPAHLAMNVGKEYRREMARV